MFFLRRPTDERLERYRLACESRPFNRPDLESAMLDAPPRGFHTDDYGVVLGRGEKVYAAAVAALESFAMYPAPWAWVQVGSRPLVPGSVYVAVVRGYGLYTVLPGRLFEVFDGSDENRRRGFSFGTIVGHVEQGVERFSVEWSPETDEVRYGVRAVWRPTALVRLGQPLARRMQLKFQRGSMDSMRASVEVRLA